MGKEIELHVRTRDLREQLGGGRGRSSRRGDQDAPERDVPRPYPGAPPPAFPWGSAEQPSPQRRRDEFWDKSIQRRESDGTQQEGGGDWPRIGPDEHQTPFENGGDFAENPERERDENGEQGTESVEGAEGEGEEQEEELGPLVGFVRRRSLS